jgi:phosphoenolpyruvate carboxykinase (ATP)
VVRNPTVSELYEYAMDPSLKYNVNPTIRPTAISSTGALVNYSGKRTGRVPKEKRVVLDKTTKNKIWWGTSNIPFTPAAYEQVRSRAIDYLNT